MTQSSKQSLLAEEINLLVRHFGIERVRSAVAKASRELGSEHGSSNRKDTSRSQRTTLANGSNALESIRDAEPEKFRLLSEFSIRLKARHVLPGTQDIRHFAQIIGLKDIGGKSREDMLPKLIRFLAAQPVEKLYADIESAADISEVQRQMGFSVLTDKLLGKS